MGKIQEPQPVMLFVGMLCGQARIMDEAGEVLIRSLGPLVHQSPDVAWTYTDYYREELGPEVFRRFLFFRELIGPDRLPEIKVKTNRIEETYSRPGPAGPLRNVNLDPGYLDAAKLVLASTKDYSHRIYLGQGIFAEVTLTFERGSFRPSRHTYPDYRSKEALEIFNQMRGLFVSRRRSQ